MDQSAICTLSTGPNKMHASLSCCNPQIRSILTKTPDLYKNVSVPGSAKDAKHFKLYPAQPNSRVDNKNSRYFPNNSCRDSVQPHEMMILPEELDINVNQDRASCHLMSQITRKNHYGFPKSYSVSHLAHINEIIDPRLNPVNTNSSRFMDPAHECNICEQSPSGMATPKCGHIAHEPIIINDHDNMTEDHSECGHEKDLNDLCEFGERRMSRLTFGGETGEICSFLGDMQF